MLLISELNRYSGLPDCNANGSGFVTKRKDQNTAMSDLPADLDDLDDLVQRTQVAAQFRRDAAHDLHVFADEFARYLDEQADGAPGGDDVQHPAGGAAMRQSAEQGRFRDAQALAEPDRLR
jgi:hypothetical protein